ncbi:MAG: hypothetical protein HC765_06430 [Brachymonas sp.]|nr:hypothetical protein [Brachymonas sp.]
MSLPSGKVGVKLLESAPYFCGFNQLLQAEYRLDPHTKGIPQVSAMVESYGLYFNSHSGFDSTALEVLGFLMMAYAQFAPVQFSALE